MDAGRAVKRSDLKPGIVGDSQHAGRLRRCDGLEFGVLGEGLAGLLRLGKAKAARRDARNAEGREQFGKLSHLALVVAGDDDPVAALQLSRHQATVSFCSATSSAMPRRASVMS